jgi:hypothetical protein
MAWKVRVAADLSELNLKQPAVIGVKQKTKKGNIKNDMLSFRSGSCEEHMANAMVEIHCGSDRVLNRIASKEIVLVVRPIEGTDVEVLTDGDFDVEEVF